MTDFMRPICIVIAVVTCAAALGGCAGPDRPGWLSAYPSNWSNRQVVDEPVLFNVAGPLEIDVESFNGDVVIQGKPELTHAQLTVVREAVHGHQRVDEARASLGEMSFSAEVIPGELGQRLQVRTQTTHAEPHFHRAHVYIEAPDIENITVRTTNGRVWMKNIRGKLDIETTEDDVRVMTNQPMNRVITIVNRNGDIDIRMRAESQGLIDAQTVNGSAATYAKYGRIVVDPATRHDRSIARFNSGTNPITLRTVNGDITVAIVHNPEMRDSNWLR